MTIKEMHWLLEQKINKVDNNQEFNLLIPEIDVKLNEALNKYITDIAIPLNASASEEVNKRILEDLKPLVKEDELLLLSQDDYFNYYKIPDDYTTFIDGYCIFKKCKKKKIKVSIRKHSSLEDFNKSSYTFEQAFIEFIDNKIRLEKPDDASIDSFKITYLRKHPYMHFAEGYMSGKYKVGDTILTGRQDCILPEHTHYAIVDIASQLILRDFNINPKTN